MTISSRESHIQFFFWTSDPWRYDHVQRRRTSDPTRCGHYRVSKCWTVTPLTYGFDHRGNRIQFSSVSDICLSLCPSLQSIPAVGLNHPTIQWTSGSVPWRRTELDVTNQFLPVQRLGLRCGISSFYTCLHGVLLRQTWIYLMFPLRRCMWGSLWSWGKRKNSVPALGTSSLPRRHIWLTVSTSKIIKISHIDKALVQIQ